MKSPTTRTLTKDTLECINKTVTVKGWVQTIRSHGKVVFIDVRDRSGILQVVGDTTLGDFRPEDVVAIVGTVVKRPKQMVNTEIITGTVELQADSATLLNRSKALPLPIDTDGRDINEETRLQYRYLDLRRPRLQKNITFRSQFIQACREYLFLQDFVEIETPLLTQSTKEGSRDFVVPSRLHPGSFFALPQSPQQYKQMLMTAGFERYFQIAKCVRDEDLRADRGFEHTQIDIEMSFVDREAVLALDEAMIIHAMEKMGATLKHKPFRRLTHAQCLKQYGQDRFDDRTKAEKEAGVLSFAWVIDFPMFKKVDPKDAAEVKDGKSGWTFEHNPFCMPKPEDLEDHLSGKTPQTIKAQQYDLICNGYEVGGGSIRAHTPEILRATFSTMGYNKREIEAAIGPMLESFSYGTPPHGGLAHGVDRLLMVLLGEKALRETVAFPQTSSGKTAVFSAPNKLGDEQLKELGIQVRSADTVSAKPMTIFDKIVQALHRDRVSYNLLVHTPVKTSEEAANVRDGSLQEGAKALLLNAGNQPVLAVVSGKDRLNLKAMKEILDCKDVSMANKEMLYKITGLKPGAVPPFGSVFSIPCYVDKAIQSLEYVSFNAGSRSRSITMKSGDYLMVENPQIVKIAAS